MAKQHNCNISALDCRAQTERLMILLMAAASYSSTVQIIEAIQIVNERVVPISPLSNSPNDGVPAGNDGTKHGSCSPANPISQGGPDVQAIYPVGPLLPIITCNLTLRYKDLSYRRTASLSFFSSFIQLLSLLSTYLLLPAFDFGHPLSLKTKYYSTTLSLNYLPVFHSLNYHFFQTNQPIIYVQSKCVTHSLSLP